MALPAAERRASRRRKLHDAVVSLARVCTIQEMLDALAEEAADYVDAEEPAPQKISLKRRNEARIKALLSEIRGNAATEKPPSPPAPRAREKSRRRRGVSRFAEALAKTRANLRRESR